MNFHLLTEIFMRDANNSPFALPHSNLTAQPRRVGTPYSTASSWIDCGDDVSYFKDDVEDDGENDNDDDDGLQQFRPEGDILTMNLAEILVNLVYNTNDEDVD